MLDQTLPAKTPALQKRTGLERLRSRASRRATQRPGVDSRSNVGSLPAILILIVATVFAVILIPQDVEPRDSLFRPACVMALGLGMCESQLIQRLEQADSAASSTSRHAPVEYWDSWRQEVQLADHIVVNSQWSRECLLKSGYADEERISVIPLAYEAPAGADAFVRQYPASFTPSRRLKVLFLGQLTTRKGILAVFEAIRLLESLPIEFTFVGPIAVEVPEELRGNSNVLFTGAVPRSQVARHYQEADVFLFPTHSDGFGLTQLEAQAWRLPVIATRFCGDVVADGLNGAILPEVAGDSIARELRRILAQPEILRKWADNSGIDERFSLRSLGSRLVELS